MNKKDFITYISDKHTITKAEVKKIVNIMRALSEGDEVSLIGFGNFLVSKVAARAGRNPQTGQVVQIPAIINLDSKLARK